MAYKSFQKIVEQYEKRYFRDIPPSGFCCGERMTKESFRWSGRTREWLNCRRCGRSIETKGREGLKERNPK